MATTGNGGGKGVVGSGGGGGGGGGEIRGNLKRFASREVKMMDPHILANELHMAEETYLLLDCRPILAYNSCHITGSVNINFTVMTKRRFMSGKISLSDLVTTEEGRVKFKSCVGWPAVVYDECAADIHCLSSSNSLRLVLFALNEMGKESYVLEGGLSEFNVLHPSLCEIGLPVVRQTLTPSALIASTPGVRDQPLDWQTAPPVHVLSYLVLGGKKDAMSKEVFDDFKIKYVLNVTPTCENYFENNKDITYVRIAVIDTGSQKLSDRFQEAFDFIEKARKANSIVLIHCMAGVSRSVTLTIAYLMTYFGLSMQTAYQLVKDKRPAISPNLNFMGQLVGYEKELHKDREIRDLNFFLPSDDQEKLTELFQVSHSKSSSSSDNTPSPKPKSNSSLGFMLKLPVGRNRKVKKLAAASSTSSGSIQDPIKMNLKNSPTPQPSSDMPPDFLSSHTPTTTPTPSDLTPTNSSCKEVTSNVRLGDAVTGESTT